MNSYHILPPRHDYDSRDHVVVVCVKRRGMVSLGDRWVMTTTSKTLSDAIHMRRGMSLQSIIPKGMDSIASTVFYFTICELQTELMQRKIFPWGDDDESNEYNYPESYPITLPVNPDNYLLLGNQ